MAHASATDTGILEHLLLIAEGGVAWREAVQALPTRRRILVSLRLFSERKVREPLDIAIALGSRERIFLFNIGEMIGVGIGIIVSGIVSRSWGWTAVALFIAAIGFTYWMWTTIRSAGVSRGRAELVRRLRAALGES